MKTSSTDVNNLPEVLRERISEILQGEPFLGQMNHFMIARTLVQSAFESCDFNGGIDDTCHAAKQMHELVDQAGVEKHSGYSPEKLQEYLRKTNQI